jgi:hypothetical protein
MSMTSILNGQGRVAAAALAIAIGMSAASSVADAEPYRRYARSDSMPAYVVGESRYGHGSVTGPVRMGRTGPQVRLPGGNWIDCARNCADTLRRETVDIWENTGSQMRNDGPGYIGFRLWF